jgi:hypothetical protein
MGIVNEVLNLRTKIQLSKPRGGGHARGLSLSNSVASLIVPYLSRERKSYKQGLVFILVNQPEDMFDSPVSSSASALPGQHPISNRSWPIRAFWIGDLECTKLENELKPLRSLSLPLTSSTVLFITYRTILIFFSCPSRSARPIAWVSIDGFHCGSRM